MHCVLFKVIKKVGQPAFRISVISTFTNPPGRLGDRSAENGFILQASRPHDSRRFSARCSPAISHTSGENWWKHAAKIQLPQQRWHHLNYYSSPNPWLRRYLHRRKLFPFNQAGHGKKMSSQHGSYTSQKLKSSGSAVRSGGFRTVRHWGLPSD